MAAACSGGSSKGGGAKDGAKGGSIATPAGSFLRKFAGGSCSRSPTAKSRRADWALEASGGNKSNRKFGRRWSGGSSKDGGTKDLALEALGDDKSNRNLGRRQSGGSSKDGGTKDGTGGGSISTPSAAFLGRSKFWRADLASGASGDESNRNLCRRQSGGGSKDGGTKDGVMMFAISCLLLLLMRRVRVALFSRRNDRRMLRSLSGRVLDNGWLRGQVGISIVFCLFSSGVVLHDASLGFLLVWMLSGGMSRSPVVSAGRFSECAIVADKRMVYENRT